jgi:O-antigen/teichoic acid export membrane protein
MSTSSQKYLGHIIGGMVLDYLVSIYMVIKLRGFSKFKSFNWDDIKENLRFSLPRMPHTLSNTILNHFDKIMLASLINLESSAIYSVGYALGMLTIVLNSSFTSGIMPNFYRLMNGNKFAHIDEINTKSVFITTILALPIVLFSAEIIGILAPKTYASAVIIVPFIVMGYLFKSVVAVYNRYIGYSKKTGYQSLSTIIIGLLNIGLNWLLIPVFGLIASAYTTTFSFFLLSLLNWQIVRNVLKLEHTAILKLFKPLLLIAPFFVLANWINLQGVSISLFIIKIIIMALVIVIFWRLGKKHMKENDN